MSVHPLFFGGGPLPLFGWLHACEVARLGLGIVLCSAWGREEVSAHASLRQWAVQLARAGWPTIRFDMVGEGDAAGAPLVDGGLDAWVGSVGGAIDELKRRTGVRRVCLLGVRSGVTVAALAAQGRDDVLGLIAVAPVVKGRGFVRELTALQAATNKRSDDAAQVAGVFQSGGFALSTAARDRLSAVDLASLPQAPAPHVLLLERDDMPASGAWAKVLASQGADVQQQALPGYVGMMADPHHVQTPQAMVDASLGWLDEVLARAMRACGETAGPSLPVPPSAEDGAAWLPVPGRPGLNVHERALVLPGGLVFGILTTPQEGRASTGQAILLLNAGSTRHIGPGRIAVDKARQWAAKGHAVLRIDLAGIGDSDTRAGCQPNLSYPAEAMQDVRAASDFLAALPGIQRVHACGLCAGAYHALKAARDGVPFASITLINPLVYFDAEGLSMGNAFDLTPQKVLSAAASYQESVLSAAKWLKLLKGQVQVRVMLKVFAKRLAASLGARLRNLARTVHWPLHNDLGTELRRLTDKGMRVHFVFAQGDPGEAMLRDGAGHVLAALQKKGSLSCHVIDEADHVFTDYALRQEMLAHVDQFMDEVTRA